MTNLFLRGTKSKSKAQLEEALANIGAQLEVTFEREIIGLTLNVEKQDATSAAALLCEMVFESTLHEETFQHEKHLA